MPAPGIHEHAHHGHEEEGLVFIHGAGLQSWIWRELPPLLDAPALFPEFPERGKGGVGNAIRLRDYAHAITHDILEWNKARVYLVMHSIGGVVGLKVAAALGPRLAGLIAIGASIPKQGGSFLSCLPFPGNAWMRLMLAVAGTKPPDSAIRKSLCAGLDGALSDRIVAEFTPESRQLYFDPCNAPVPSVPKLYLKTAHDGSMPGPLQDRMAENFRCSRLEVLDTGHLPMLTAPQAVAASINRFIALPRRAFVRSRAGGWHSLY